jgi:hypothetical protein
MVGVSSPLRRTDRPSFRRFIAGLVTGGSGATALTLVVLFFVGTPLRKLSADFRLYLAQFVLCATALVDLLGRTPFLRRQVPQRFIRDLPPTMRGLAWGSDLYIRVSTIKTTSLFWALFVIYGLFPSYAVAIGILFSTFLELVLITVFSSRPRLIFEIDGTPTRDAMRLPRAAQTLSGVMLGMMAILVHTQRVVL